MKVTVTQIWDTIEMTAGELHDLAVGITQSEHRFWSFFTTRELKSKKADCEGTLFPNPDVLSHENISWLSDNKMVKVLAVADHVDEQDIKIVIDPP